MIVAVGRRCRNQFPFARPASSAFCPCPPGPAAA